MPDPGTILDSLLDSLENATTPEETQKLVDSAADELEGLKGERPEYVKCVKHPRDTKSMCRAQQGGWMFYGIDAAFATRANGDRLLVCPQCAFEIYKTLLSSD